MKTTYEKRAEKLAKAVSLAIEAFRKFPPKGMTQKVLEDFIKSYEQDRIDALEPLPQYKNLKSLKYVEENIFIPFQEAEGAFVEYFWERIKEENLDFIRVNKLKQVLKKNEIQDDIEYNYVIDVILIAQQENKISKKQLEKLNNMLKIYEERLARK